jgi:tetratricopeptide (TPR) repeat protein
MRSSILFLFAALSTGGVAVPAAAHTIQEQAARCTDENNRSADDVMATCTAVIASRQLTGSELSKAYEARAIAFNMKNDTDHAIDDYEVALRLNPDNTELYEELCESGRIILRRELDRACTECGEALQRNDVDSDDILINRGLVGLKQKRFQDAWNDFDAALKLNGAKDTCLYGRGFAEMQLGRTSEGHADIAAAESITSDIAGDFAEPGVSP